MTCRYHIYATRRQKRESKSPLLPEKALEYATSDPLLQFTLRPAARPCAARNTRFSIAPKCQVLPSRHVSSDPGLAEENQQAQETTQQSRHCKATSSHNGLPCAAACLRPMRTSTRRPFVSHATRKHNGLTAHHVDKSHHHHKRTSTSSSSSRMPPPPPPQPASQLITPVPVTNTSRRLSASLPAVARRG